MRLVVFILFVGINLQAQTNSGEKLLTIAQQKNSEGKWNEALDYLNQCLNAQPALVEAYMLRGEVKEKLNYPTQALTDYSIAVELMPQMSEAYLNRGVLAYKLKRFDLARSDFRKLLTIKNTETNTVYFRQSNNESVDKIFTAQSGIHDLVYNYLGLIETEAGEISKSILYFDSAIAVNSKAPDYFAHRGLAWLKSGNNEKAVQDFYQALILDPDHAVSKNNLAAIKRKEGNFAEAEKFLMEAKRANAKAPNHYSALALLQLESGRYQESILNFDTAIALEPKDGDLFINRGLAKEKRHDWNGALLDFEAALQIDPEWPKAWFVQGNNFMKQEKWQQALENYTVAITYDDNYSIAYYNRAIVQFKLGQKKQACDDLQMAESKGITVDNKMRIRICGK